MSEKENIKPDVFSRNREPERISETEVKPIFKNNIEEDAHLEIERNAQRQMKIKAEGMKLGLTGTELIQYIIKESEDIAYRPELAENYGAPKEIEVIYNTPEDTSHQIKPSKTVKKVEVIKEDAPEEEDTTDYDALAKSMIESKASNVPTKTLEEIQEELNRVLDLMSQTQYEAPFDFVKLPSLSKQYKGIGESIRVAYLNGSDEDVLTNPGVLSSGKFLDVLFKRKIIEPGFDIGKLLPQDRDAIMLWLRSTAYGNDYPIEVENPKTKELFSANVDLSKLPVKYIDLDVNERGFFEFETTDGILIEYNLLTLQDIYELEQVIIEKAAKYSGLYASSGSDEVLRKMIRGIDGNYNKKELEGKIKYMLMKHIIEFRRFLNEHDFGVDLLLKLNSPEGEVIETQFPFGTHFFWAEF